MKFKKRNNQWTRYFSVRDVDPSTQVDAFIERCISDYELNVHPSLVTLRRVSCTPGNDPSPEQEEAASDLSSWRTLRGAHVEDGSFLRIDFDAAQPSTIEGACCMRALKAPLRPHHSQTEAPHHTEPLAKRARVVADESDAYARALLAVAPGALATPADVRSFLAQPPPLPVLVDESHATLLAEGANCFPMQVRPPERSMAELEALLESAFRWHIVGGSEEVWASLADALVGRVWRTLSALCGKFAYVDDRNTVDRSGATQRRLRPDYCGWINHVLVAKAEHKGEVEELLAALQELASKMRVWNPLVMRGMPLLPCFAVGGHLIQFAVVRSGPAGKACVEPVTDPISMATPRDRLRVVALAFNMFRIITALRAHTPPHVIPLYKEQPRADGSITVFDDYVIKRCRRVAPTAVYDALAAAAIPCAVRVVEYAAPSAERPLARLKLAPVAVQMLPGDEAELRFAVIAVLRALAALHARGFAHRDVRWPNVLADGQGGWLLVDFELSDAVGAPLPAHAIDPDSVAPEARVPDAPYTAGDDIWQVGRLLRSADVQLSPEAAALATALMAPRAARLCAARALAHPWLAQA